MLFFTVLRLHLSCALPCECDLENLVPSNKRSQSSERLFARATHANKESIPTRCTDNTRDLMRNNLNIQ